MAILFTLRILARNLLRGYQIRNIFILLSGLGVFTEALRLIAEVILFVFCFDVWPGVETQRLNYGDFNTTIKYIFTECIASRQ